MGIAIILLSAAVASAKPLLTPSELVMNGERLLRGRSTQMLTTMTVYRKSYTRRLKLRTWSLGHNRSLVEILEPAKEEGTVSLRSEAQIWNYLPKSDHIVKVPVSMLMQSWMGSDFTNDDLLKVSSIEMDYTHQFTAMPQANGVKVIECLPRPGAAVVWGKILYWARASDGLPERQEFFDDQNNRVRSITYSVFRRMDDRVVPTRIGVRQVDNAEEFTELVHEKILFDRRIDETIFDREQLKASSHKGKDLNGGWVVDRIAVLN